MGLMEELLGSRVEKATSSILYATAVSDSEDGYVRVVFDGSYALDDDGDDIPDVILWEGDEGDTEDSIDEDYDALLLGPDDEGYVEGGDNYVEPVEEVDED